MLELDKLLLEIHNHFSSTKKLKLFHNNQKMDQIFLKVKNHLFKTQFLSLILLILIQTMELWVVMTEIYQVQLSQILEQLHLLLTLLLFKTVIRKVVIIHHIILHRLDQNITTFLVQIQFQVLTAIKTYCTINHLTNTNSGMKIVKNKWCKQHWWPVWECWIKNQWVKIQKSIVKYKIRKKYKNR